MKLIILSLLLISCSTPNRRPAESSYHEDDEDSLTWLIREHKQKTREREQRDLIKKHREPKPVECNYTCLGR